MKTTLTIARREFKAYFNSPVAYFVITVFLALVGIMFFIPFFGAAVSGRKTGVEGYKEAIVVLLGPVPGLFISLLLILTYATTQIDVLRQLAIWFAVINAFNLLPIPPLDGHWILMRYLPEPYRGVLASIRPYGFMILIVLMMTRTLGMLIGPPYSFIVNGLYKLVGLAAAL